MNRIARFEQIVLSAGLSEEIDSLIQIFEESDDPEKGEFGRYDAFCEMAQDSDDPQMAAHLFKKEIRKICIELGIYREVSQKELDNTVTLGGKKYCFQMDGKKYTFVSW